MAMEYQDFAPEFGGAPLVHWAQMDSDFDTVREDPRFQAVMTKVEARLAAANPDGSAHE